MLVFSRLFKIHLLAISAVLFFLLGGKVAPPKVSEPLETHRTRQSVSMVIWTDHAKYSLRDAVKLNASLQNTGDALVYVDRRMFWTGYGGGLKLEISDEKGKPVPARLLSDALMPPPREGDTSILVPLDEGFFYGTSVNLLVADIFKKPGRYSIRVIYKSWLRKEFVTPQLRDRPALWADAPAIASEQVWIEVTR
jgi:hypothetical protein